MFIWYSACIVMSVMVILLHIHKGAMVERPVVAYTFRKKPEPSSPVHQSGTLVQYSDYLHTTGLKNTKT